MEQIIAVFVYDRAGVDLPPTDLRLVNHYKPEDFDLENLEDRLAVDLENQKVEILTTLEMLENGFPILLEQVKTRVAGWWENYGYQLNAHFQRLEKLRNKIMGIEPIVAIFDYSDGGISLPPEDFKLMGYYIPEDSDLNNLDYGLAVYLDNKTVEILTTLKMLHRNNLPALLEQVEEDTAEWWEDHSDQVNAYYKENYWLNMSLYRAMRGE